MSRGTRKYYSGLSKRQATRRRREIGQRKTMSWLDPAAYKPFATDKGVGTRSSGYTTQWKRRFPAATSMEAKSAATGVPLKYLRECYNRGLAAWRTGHRPGATQQQWGYARVHSLLLCGKTYHTTDADIAKEAKAASASAKAWWSKCRSR